MKRRIEIDTATWIVRLIRDARANGGHYEEPPVYRRVERKRDTWLARRLAEKAQEGSRD